MSAAKFLIPGKTIGVLGGGQLGRMLAQAATRLGYRVHVFEPQANSPAGAVAHKEVNAPYEDLAALAAFARECDVITYEFENVPAAPLKHIESLAPLRPHRIVRARNAGCAITSSRTRASPKSRRGPIWRRVFAKLASRAS